MANPPRLDKGGPLIIPAAEWNKHCDVSDWFQRHRSGQVVGSLRPAYDTSILDLRNDSGGNRRKGEILEFSGLVPADLSDGLPWLIGSVPAMQQGFGLLLQDLPTAEPDNFGKCQTYGNAIALVNIISTSHKYASPKKDSYVLQSCPAGPVRILFKPPGTGEKTCAVFVTQDPTGLVKPVGNISKGDPGDCKVWLNGADTGATVNLIAIVGDCDAGFYATQWGGYVFPGECP